MWIHSLTIFARTSLSQIDKIFITHAHGDHCFGLPGLLCLIARGRDSRAPPLELYGPSGLRAFVRASLSFTGTRMLPPYVVHEIRGIPNLRRNSRGSGEDEVIPSHGVPHGGGGQAGLWGEVRGSRELHPAADGSWWTLLYEEGIKVSAVPVHHTVPCLGYIVAEDDKDGRLQADKAMPLLEANRQAIREQWGVRDPRSVLKRVKALGVDGEMELPDGSVLRGKDVLGEARRGRKLVLLGDCCDASMCVELGRGCDMLVHEATNAYLPMVRRRSCLSPEASCHPACPAALRPFPSLFDARPTSRHASVWGQGRCNCA